MAFDPNSELLASIANPPMESTLSAATPTTVALLAVSRTLNRRLSQTFLSQRLPSRLLARRLTSCLPSSYGFQRPNSPFSSSSLRSLCLVDPAGRCRLGCVGSSAASFASGGGNGGFGGESGGSGGDGEGGSGGGDAKSKVVAAGCDEISTVSTDVIVLDVGPQVSSASVNLTTETAVVWPVSEAKVTPNWQKQLGETLAKHLTNCGFKSNLRVF
ncbi:Copper-transporting ATPase PAA1, chloroplastic [Prunus dulcis]|uniref:Copper-transporting ATPase PAA1, chloroplastic n=1 Tax=Prunus dulcis TaxID=3755 RepID=A0A5H2Y4M9_PRUDU|nr:Copper-transporting ATPase PAA1, chloroplastic [Prunus dulcis]